MANTARNLVVAAAAAAVLATPGLSEAADALPGVESALGRHVRSSNSDLIALIDQAGERSATFRGLLDTINASDSIVFVEAGDCGHGDPPGGTFFLSYALMLIRNADYRIR